MTRRPALAALFALAAIAPFVAARAQEIAPMATAPVRAPAVLHPFTANYEVFKGGSKLGNATLRLQRLEGGRWSVDLGMRGSGLMRFAGLDLQQATVFSAAGNDWRPLAQSTMRNALFSHRKTTGSYDWAAMRAQWTGDVKKTRRAPVPLQAGDLSGLLINLAVIRDAVPGATLNYRFVDDGRARLQSYQVAPALEQVTVTDLPYAAMRVDRVHAGGGDRTTLWVSPGVPTPIRIQQFEDGRETYDLRLVDYTSGV